MAIRMDTKELTPQYLASFTQFLIGIVQIDTSFIFTLEKAIHTTVTFMTCLGMATGCLVVLQRTLRTVPLFLYLIHLIMVDGVKGMRHSRLIMVRLLE